MKKILFILPLLVYSDTLTISQCKEHKGGANSGTHHARGGKMYDIKGVDANGSVSYYLPTLEKKDIPYNNKITPPKTGLNNYHAIVAKSTKDNINYTAISYPTGFGRPAKHTPRELVDIQKSVLEIKPNPLPREHDSYKGSKEYKFVVMFDNKPLADTDVKISTLNNTNFGVKTDKNGLAKVTLPNDFSDVLNSRRANKPSEFTLSVENKNYVTTYTMPYYVNPNDYWQESDKGLGVIAIGFISTLAGFSYFRRRKNG